MFSPRLLALPALLLSFGSHAADTAADTVFVNAVVYTMDKDRSQAQAVAVADGRIAYVGSNEGVRILISESTRVVDLAGNMLLPSFQDVHIHPVSGGMAYRECPLFELETMQAVIDTVADCVKATPDAEFTFAFGWNWGIFGEGEAPNRMVLDKIDAKRPVILGDSDGHTLWLNSPALEFAEIDAETVAPEGGEIGRLPGSNEPDGTLLEGPAMDLVMRKLPPTTPEQFDDALNYTQRYLHSLGITAMQDAYVRLVGDGPNRSLETYRRAQQRGTLQLRVVAALNWEPDLGLQQMPALLAARETYSEGRLQASAIKLWADGIVESHTALLLEPYADKPQSKGMLMIPLTDLQAAVPKLDAAGFQIHIHAIGDGTVRHALDLLESAREANGARDSRHLTAHTQLVHPDDLPRFAKLGVIAGFSPYWAYADSYVADINPPQLGPQRMGWMYPIKSIQDSGGRVAFGSDWSVSTADPLLGIETAVTRVAPEGKPTPVFLPNERIELDRAIAAYTIDAAYANFLDQDTGSIEVGKYADVIVLDRNLFELKPEQISDARVVATYLEGQQVYPTE